MEKQIAEIESNAAKLTEKIMSKRDLMIKEIRKKEKELHDRIHENPTWEWDITSLIDSLPKYTLDPIQGIPRNIQITRIYDESLGFAIKTKNGNKEGSYHHIANVTQNGLAARAGLQSGDLICCINKMDATRKNHPQLIMTFKSNQKLELTVLDSKAFHLYNILNIEITHELANYIANISQFLNLFSITSESDSNIL